MSVSGDRLLVERSNPEKLLLWRVAPALVALIVVCGTLRWLLEYRGVISSALGTSLMGLISSASVVLALAWGARLVRSEVRRRRALEKSESFRLFARNLPGGGIFVFDRDLRHTLAESDGLEAIGLSPVQLEGKTIFELFDRELADELADIYRDALKGQMRREEMDMGDETYLVTVVPDRDERRAVVGGIVLSQRISEQRQLREQLLQAQKMDAVGQLAGGVAHDFNNLLLAIRGYTELERSTPRAEHLEQILLAVDRAAALTSQLLAFSRQQVVKPERLDTCAVVRDLEPLLDRLLGTAIELVKEPSSGNCHVVVDRHQLEQIILNLVINARDAMPDGGRISITSGEVRIDESWPVPSDLPPGRYIRLGVTDTGTGVAPSALQHLFEPFFTTKEPGKGTGLGLSTVYGIAKQYGGSVHVYSEEGHGATFSVYFPCADETESELALEPAPSREQLRTFAILLVEDDPIVNEVVSELLRQLGHRVTTALAPEDALASLASGGHYELLITDFALPGMNGWELAERVADVAPATRILFTSGYSAHQELEDAVMSGRAAFLQKPFSAADLQQAIATAVGATPPVG